ncbi:MAG: hypothetical protein WCB27_24500, partial [Thermoguttaceae bacterium]
SLQPTPESNSNASTRQFRSVEALVVILGAAVADAETPVVVFDLPLTVECRDVTPQRYEASYRRKIFEAVVRISPQLLAGEEKDLKKLHYEISTAQQMPVVSFVPSSQVTSDVADGTIAIQTDDHHGQLLVHYLVTPAAGDGKLTADLNSSHAQYTLLAPKQILVASGTIERGCGVYYDLKPSTQDTLQKQREFACLFDVPATWRANCITVRCKALGVKRGLLGSSDVSCGGGMLSVGLYKQNDAEAMAAAYELGRKQQQFLNQLRADPKFAGSGGPASLLGGLALAKRASSSHAGKMDARRPSTAIGASLQAQIAEDKSLQADLSDDTRAAARNVAAAMLALRKLNAAP